MSFKSAEPIWTDEPLRRTAAVTLGCALKRYCLLTGGAFFWGYSSYSYSGLGITEYTEFLFRKERSLIWKRNTHGGGDLRTTLPASRDRRERPRRISLQKYPKRTRILSIPNKPYSFHSVHSAIGSRMNGMIFRLFRKRNSSQKNTNTVYSEYSYSEIVPKERALGLA